MIYPVNKFRRMKKLNLLLFSLVLFSLFLLGCEKNQTVETSEAPIHEVNNPPVVGDIKILNLTYHSATLYYAEAPDSDQDSIYYSLYINDSLVLQQASNSILFKFENLKHATQYECKLRITDSINPSITIDTAFSTLEFSSDFDFVYSNNSEELGSGTSIALCDDGGYVVFGSIRNYTHDAYILKIDSSGYEQWHQVLDFPTYYNESKIITLNNGEFLAVFNSYVIRLNTSGEIIWAYEIENSYFHGVCETMDQDIIVSANFEGTSILIKLSPSGELIWNLTLHNEYISYSHIIINSSGNIIMLGDGDEKFILSEVDLDGNILHTKRFNEFNIFNTCGIIERENQEYLFAGYGYDKTQIVKIDSDGEVMWYINASDITYKFIANSLISTKNNHIALCGFKLSSPDQAIIQLYDDHGAFIKKAIYDSDDSDYNWRFIDIKNTIDDYFILTGMKSSSYNYDQKPEGIWIKKTNDFQ